VVQRDQRDRQRRRLFEAHAVRHRVHATPVADCVFGIPAGAGAHDAIAGPVALDFCAGFDHLARPFESDRRADPAMAAMGAAAPPLGAPPAGPPPPWLPWGMPRAVARSARLSAAARPLTSTSLGLGLGCAISRTANPCSVATAAFIRSPSCSFTRSWCCSLHET